MWLAHFSHFHPHVDVHNQLYEWKLKEVDIKHALLYLIWFVIIDNGEVAKEDALNL
jgi:hypothetical protein